MFYFFSKIVLMYLVNGLTDQGSPVAQWLERYLGGHGSGDSDFFFSCPTLVLNEQLIFVNNKDVIISK